MKIRFFHPLSIFLLTVISHGAFAVSREDAKPSHTYKLDGVLKNKFEHATEIGTSRFTVRNSRMGIAGDINGAYGYRVQVEWSDEGQFKVLDLSGTIKPVKGLSFTLGQTSIPLFNSYIVSPNEMMFANRAFIGKYFLSTRDLGFLTRYDLHLGEMPTRLEFGLFNGNAINSPVWKKKMAYGGRVIVGSMKGARLSAKIYDYPKEEETHHLFYGADLRYEGSNWILETEVMKRKSKTEFHTDLLSYYLQGAYVLSLKTKLFDSLQPALRWDGISDTQGDVGFDVKRLTAGVGFGSKRDRFTSILRVNYEWYFGTDSPTIFKNQEVGSDKVTVELLLRF
ncbi:MAG: hypothetical protein ACOX19_03580 [Fermentimonas sp.]|jgi:hypothetical protein